MERFTNNFRALRAPECFHPIILFCCTFWCSGIRSQWYEYQEGTPPRKSELKPASKLAVDAIIRVDGLEFEAQAACAKSGLRIIKAS